MVVFALTLSFSHSFCLSFPFPIIIIIIIITCFYATGFLLLVFACFLVSLFPFILSSFLPCFLASLFPCPLLLFASPSSSFLSAVSDQSTGIRLFLPLSVIVSSSLRSFHSPTHRYPLTFLFRLIVHPPTFFLSLPPFLTPLPSSLSFFPVSRLPSVSLLPWVYSHSPPFWGAFFFFFFPQSSTFLSFSHSLIILFCFLHSLFLCSLLSGLVPYQLYCTLLL